VVLYALNKGSLDPIPLWQISSYEQELVEYITSHENKLLSDIDKEGQLTDAILKELDQVLSNFNHRFLSKGVI
jgi:F0F1-type ATP synthase alpha subunit